MNPRAKTKRSTLSEVEGYAEKGESQNMVVLFMDLIGFSKSSDNSELRKVVEKLNVATDHALLSAELTQVVGRLPTGDGALLIFSHDLRERVVRFAEGLLNRMRKEKSFLRIGIHLGRVSPTTLGVSGSKNFCGHAINVTQRIMDLADGADGKHAIACSEELVDTLPNAVKARFGRIFYAQAKHGQCVNIRFLYTLGKVPSPEKERVRGPLAVLDWKIRKLGSLEGRNGVNFYAFGEEKDREERETFHKQLIRKSFKFEKSARPDGIVDVTRFKSLKLDTFPVRFSPSHETYGICGPMLDIGDLAYGAYRLTFYFSVFGGRPGVELSLQARYAEDEATDCIHLFQEKSGRRSSKANDIVLKLDGNGSKFLGQKKRGWSERSIEFFYAGQSFVQFRFMLGPDGNLPKPVEWGDSIPNVWFYKVHLELLPVSVTRE